MIQIIPKEEQAYGAFNNGEIVENKPIGFNREGGKLKPYSNIFYWANAIAKVDSTIGLHPHQGFEIMSFVLEGTIRHFDTKLKEWRELNKGDVQIIRAGNGISHAEHMNEGARMFQIWFDPDLDKTMSQEASYDDYKASEFKVINEEGVSIVSMIGEDAPINMDAPEVVIEKWNVTEKYNFSSPVSVMVSIYVLEGTPLVNGQRANADDFILVTDKEEISIEGNCNLFVIKSPVSPPYKTYSQIMQERLNVS